MNHDKYIELSWREKKENMQKLFHLYQNSEWAFERMNMLLKKAERENLFKNVDFFPPTEIINEKQISHE